MVNHLELKTEAVNRVMNPNAAASSGHSYVVVTDSNFDQEVIQATLPVLVDFWADWCGPCKMIAPILDQLAAEYAGKARIAKINVDENPQMASQFGITSIPTLLLFKNGKVVDKAIGAVPKKVLAGKLDAQLA